MDINEAAQTGAAEPGDTETTGSVARRRLLVAGAAGSALSLLPFLVGRAGASSSPTATSSVGGSANTFTSATSGSNNGPTGNSTADQPSTGSKSGSQGGGYSGTADSTNSPSAVTTKDSTGGSVPAGTGATSGSTVDSAAATTTTAPPRRPTDDDLVLLQFAQMLELTVRDLYRLALDLKAFDEATSAVVKAIGEAHGAYAQSISGLIGRTAPNSPITPLYSKLKASFTGDSQSVAASARQLENDVVATHTEIIGKLAGVDGSALIASMVVIEARHATVLARIAGIVGLDDQLATDGKPYSPSDYPAK